MVVRRPGGNHISVTPEFERDPICEDRNVRDFPSRPRV
jgi:hypothetical protein